MATATSEQRELELVEKVLFRILGVANNEEKLQALLKVYLPPLLLKLGSEHASVRTKVMEICRDRLNTFIQPPSIILPVAALLDQYKSTQSPLVKHFDLVFIQHSVRRLEPFQRRELIPKALSGIGTDTGAGIASLFNVVLHLLQDLKLPPRGSTEDVSFKNDVGLSDPKDSSFIAEWLGKVLLLRSSARQSVSTGLTSADLEFLGVNKPNTWDNTKGLNLAETRIKAASFLTSGAFTDEERFIPAIYAASIPDFRINGIGDDMLKRTSVSLEDAGLVKKLFEAHMKLQAPYRIKILGLLSKSEVSTTFTNEILEVFRQNVGRVEQVQDAMDIDRATSAPVSIGLEMMKVHRALFEYINWVARIGPSKTDFSKIGSPLIDMLRDYIYSQGWPKPTKQTLDDVTLRSRAYETIGLLAKSTAMQGPNALSLVGWLFRSLSEDPTPDVVVNIDGALSSLTSLFKPPLQPATKLSLRTILLTYMTMQEEGDVVRSARHAATKWANSCLPFSNIHARWIDILAIAGRRDERNEVIEEGHKGLDPWTYYANDETTKELPHWGEMVGSFFKEPIIHLNTTDWIHGRGGMDVDEQSVFANFTGDTLNAFPIAVEYCKKILFLTALKDLKIEPGWERQLEALVQSDKASHQTIRAYLSSTEANEQSALALLTAAFEGMLQENTALVEKCARSFVEVASFSPASTLKQLASRSHELLPLITSNKPEFRSLSAKAFGILAAHPANSPESIAKSKAALIAITKNFKTAIGSDLNAVQGAFIALAHLVSRLVYYSTETPEAANSDLPSTFPSLDSVSSAPLSVQEALFDSYTQLWTAAIPTLSISKDQELSRKDLIVKQYVEPLVVQATKGNERAITTLGRLAIAFPSSSSETENDILDLILEKLYKLHEIKRAEVHFAVGEAITAAIACWDADVVQLTLDVQSTGKSHLVGKRTESLQKVLQKLLTDCKTTKPSLLKASGIWLFCIIQHCSNLEEIQSRLRECQVAFMRLLSARDELVQETASRGLALVYERGDPALKEELVRDLVSSFTGSGPQLKVDEETELFDAGALPTGEGKSITSYKDIVSLANEVGDQSLVYKFMSLATNAATWSTRSAFGRFGLSNILSESEVDPKLYPKLYRYRFDPNQNVQKSMTDIWKALVKDSNAVLDEHFDAIMKDLLKSVLGKEWRVREATCAAISDLISGRPFPKYEMYYKDIWTAALKVLDDVKTTVRNAALHLCIALSNTLVRQLEESGSSSTATAMMNEALPFLMSEKGIESGVEDVKIFSTITIIKIAKGGGKSLNPYIPGLVPHLLGLLSTIEPDAINYHYLRAGEDNREKIDRIRSAMVSQSPIFEAVENCLRSVNKQVMSELAPGLENTIKSAVGMPTKIGCSRVLATLAMRHAAEFGPYAARFLQLMEKQVLDKNDEVSQSYARSAAYIIRVVPIETQQRFVDKLIGLYLKSEDETRRAKVADAILGLSKISPDQFNALESQILPFAFLGKHDTDEDVAKEFEEVWEKHAGSNLTVTRYIPEIVAVVQKTLDTTQWALKHAGALTTASAVSSVTNASTLSGQINLENLKALWPVYEKALALKTFPSKEKLLDAFPDFVGKGKALWEKDTAFAKLLEKIAIREAKRNNDDYRPHAFRCLWRFAAARDDLSMLTDIAAIVTPYLDLSPDEDAMDVDKPKGSKARGLDPKSQAAWAAIEALAKGYNRHKMSEDPLAELRAVIDALDISEKGSKPKGSAKDFTPCISTEPFDDIRRGFWYECVVEIFDEASKAEKAGTGGLASLSWFLCTLDLKKAEVGTEAQRLNRTKAVAATLKFWKKQTSLGASKESGKEEDAEKTTLRENIQRAIKEDRSLEVQARWKTCLDLVSELGGQK